MHIPKSLLYTLEHAWVKVSDNLVVIGITDDLQEILESIDAVDLPRVGDELYIGDNCATIHHSGGLYDLPCPLTGRITKVNPSLRRHPELLQASPYKDGWLFEMEIDEPDELELMLDAADYQREVENL